MGYKFKFFSIGCIIHCLNKCVWFAKSFNFHECRVSDLWKFNDKHTNVIRHKGFYLAFIACKGVYFTIELT